MLDGLGLSAEASYMSIGQKARAVKHMTRWVLTWQRTSIPANLHSCEQYKVLTCNCSDCKAIAFGLDGCFPM